MKIIMDIREPASINMLLEAMSYDVEVLDITEELEMSGDYYFKCDNGELLIERKTIPDFDGSMVNGHLFDQAMRMTEWCQAEPNRIAFIKTIGQTNEYNGHANVNYTSRIGAMNSIMIRYGLPVSNYTTEADFIWAVHKLCRSLYEGKKGKFRTTDLFNYKHPDINLKSNDPNEIFINNFRIWGATKKQAEDIVDVLLIESVNDLISLTYDDLIVIKGIGDKTVMKIMNRMGIVEDV